MGKVSYSTLQIDDKERLILDGQPLKGVLEYSLHHAGTDAAKLTVTLPVILNRSSAE